ncbi:MAG: hypothetical protein AMXMBFR61_21790 [Fimbriimonadales bacterium]
MARVGVLLLVFWVMQIVAQILFKWGSLSESRWMWGFWGGNALGLSSIWLLMLVYRVINPNVALGVAAGGAFLLSQVAIAVAFRSKVAPVQWLGIATMVVGMLLLATGGMAQRGESDSDGSLPAPTPERSGREAAAIEPSAATLGPQEASTMKSAFIPPIPTPEDMAESRALYEQFFTDPSKLPITYLFDGRQQRGIPKDWQPVIRTRSIDANLVEMVCSGGDPRTGLEVRVECLIYRDYPVIEWVAWFTNRGTAPTPLLSDVLALDATLTGPAPILHYYKGDFWNEQGYEPQESALSPGTKVHLAPNGGRPCDGWFPYFRILFEGRGLACAIGWPAQWSLTLEGASDGVHGKAGQEKTRLRLDPGESIRTPRMTVLAWKGDEARAINLWRRWYLAHLLPRSNGQPLQPLLAVAATDEGEEFTAATEENQLRYMAKFREHGIPFDVWWIDAGWYPCFDKEGQRRWWITGNWYPDPDRFPKGMKSVSEAAEKSGAKLLVWFEPERVQAGTMFEHDHPDWLLRAKDNDNALFNLGNPDCRQWLTDHVCKLIRDNGIRIYRQDHNFPPLQHWRENEAEDRQGMNENLYVQGYLRYWDDLLERNPGLWIDSCASGGRRNDLETMRRSVPLHYSDYGYGDHPVKLAFQRTLYEWIPYFKDFTLSWDLTGGSRFDASVDPFAYHTGMAPMLFVTLDIRRDDYDFELSRKLIALWRKAAHLLVYGDYYALTPYHRDATQWVVRQFDEPTTGRGAIQAIRLPKSADESFVVRPKGVDAEARYVFENGNTGETVETEGQKLQSEGFTITLPQRSAVLWFYRKL